jgi:FkbM family methyltransferase
MNLKHLVEVGCTDVASLHDMFHPDAKIQIIEANEFHISALKNIYKNMPNVEIHPYAIWKEPGRVLFHKQGATSYVDGLDSPVTVYPEWQGPTHELVEVEAKTFDEFDDGTIDIIDIDIEGAEWYVLQKMVSRPNWIIIEMGWGKYVNPFKKEIEDWMSDNKYRLFSVHGGNNFYRICDEKAPTLTKPL